MVGGYVYFLGKTLAVGEYDLVEIFGSFEAAEDYINRVYASGKQLLGAVKTDIGIYVGVFELSAYNNPFRGTIGGVFSAVVNINKSERSMKFVISVVKGGNNQWK